MHQDQLESFLSLAEDLQLKGFTGSGETGNRGGKVEEKPKEVSVRNHKSIVNDTQRREGGLFRETQITQTVKSETIPTIQPKPKLEFETLQLVESLIVKRDSMMFCNNCDYTSKHGGHMREHVEKHIEGLEYPCNVCGKVLKTSHNFRQHKRKCV